MHEVDSTSISQGRISAVLTMLTLKPNLLFGQSTLPVILAEFRDLREDSLHELVGKRELRMQLSDCSPHTTELLDPAHIQRSRTLLCVDYKVRLRREGLQNLRNVFLGPRKPLPVWSHFKARADDPMRARADDTIRAEIAT